MENNPNSNALNSKLADALAKCQGQIEAAEKSQKNEAFKKDGKASKYADIADVIEAIKNPCAENGLSTSFNYKTEISDQGRVRNFIQYKLRHSSGEHELSDWVLMLSRDESQHGWGGANTYYRRQLLKGIFQIPEEDDDGNAGSGVRQQNSQAPINNPANRQKLIDEIKTKVKQKDPDDIDAALNQTPMTNLEKLYALVDERGWPPEVVKEKMKLCLGFIKPSKELSDAELVALLKYINLSGPVG